MTEIEKARLDLKTSVSLLQLERGEHEAYRSERTVSTIEALIDAKLAEHANRIRAIAREEIKAALEPMPKVYDTLLAEVERLRTALPAPPLPAEVEEMRGRILVALLHAAIRASNDEAHKMAAYFDSVRDEAASLLSRWPGGQAPEPTNE